MYNLEKLFKGIVAVEENNGLIELKRFTDKQLEFYKKQGGDALSLRARCPAGVRMEFITEEKELSFDFVANGFAREWLGFDVYENGELKMSDTREGKVDSGSFLHKVEGEGKVKIEIYFMFSCDMSLKNLKLGEIEYLEEEKINYLALGDSITQGFVTKSASINYPAIISREYNLNLLNHGVGGFWFDKESLDPELPFEPDIITIAYGTNDTYKAYAKNQDASGILEAAKEYVKEVLKLYPESSVKIITPIWYHLESDAKYKSVMDSVRKGLSDIGKELGLDVIDGTNLVPADPSYYGDSPSVHPNVDGFIEYARNLNIK